MILKKRTSVFYGSINIKSMWRSNMEIHYDDVIMTTIASQITSLTSVYSTVYSDAHQRKHQSSASLAFVWGIHRDRWIPRTKGQLRGKCFHLMTSSWHWDLVHPCEKVIGIFFRHKFFITHFLLFVLVFIHDICEVVSMNSVDFCCISITGYIPVTFWKRLQGKNPMLH